MSIFKESFEENIKIQLGKRQDAMLKRSPTDLRYINSRNAWVRMSSGVNIYKEDAPNPPTQESLANSGNYDNSLAKKYVLQGGTLYNNTLRSGITEKFADGGAYSISGSSGPYRLGIRPLPGITGVDVKSRGAYGSLRDVTVNFQCWDIKQLEDLELLYMRPGYTVLIEWGWAPYLDNSGNIQTNVQFYDIINNPKTKEEIWKDLETKSSATGNYEAMFGFVKNYSWSARPDGGYDCQTTIISMGEVLESLKVNFTPANVLENIGKNGYLNATVKGDVETTFVADDIKKQYGKNILAGMFWELWKIAHTQNTGNTTSDEGESFFLTDKKKSVVDGLTDYKFEVFHKTIDIKGMSENFIGEEDEQYYITLETLCYLLNNYVMLHEKNNNSSDVKTYVRLSVKEDKGISNAETGEDFLLCAAHPLQVSVDPSVCLIRNDLWSNGIKINIQQASSTGSGGGNPSVTFRSNIPDVSGFVDRIISICIPTTKIGKRPDVLKLIKDTIKGPNEEYSKGQVDENIKEINRVYLEKLNDSKYKIPPPSQSDIITFGLVEGGSSVGNTIKWLDGEPNSFYELLILPKWGNFDGVRTAIGDSIATLGGSKDIVADEQEKIKEKQKEINKAAEKGKENLSFLTKLLPYFKNNDWKTELGIIGNIYVNIQHLYDLSLNSSLAAQDKKEKNDVSVYDFIKNLLNEISSCIGNTSTLELYIEPNASVARIIDIAFTGDKSIYNNAFQLEVHGLKTTARSYKLESKIFQEQSTMVAIGAQAGGGALGTDTSALIDFNKKIIDRIVTEKISPTDTIAQKANETLAALAASLGTLYKYFSDLSFGFVTDADFDIEEAGTYKNALKDLINLFKSVTNYSSKAILPTVFSTDIDGIGGLIIGNVFRIPDDVLPKGYRGKGAGSKLGYVITGIGHSIQGGDWVTKIDSQTIILDDPSPKANFDYSNITIDLNASDPREIVKDKVSTSSSTPPSGTGFPNSSRTQKIIKTYLNGIPPAAQYSDGTFIIDKTESLGGNLPPRQWLKLNSDFVKSLVEVEFPLAGGKSTKKKVHPTFKQKLDIIIPKLKTTKYKNKFLTEYITSCAGSLAIRNATPSKTELSFHSYALAIDLNADRYAYGKPWNIAKKTWTDNRGNIKDWTDFEYGFFEVAKIFEANGVGWYWNNDPHHFSIGEGLPAIP